MQQSPGSELISKLKRLRASLSRIESSSDSDEEFSRKKTSKKKQYDTYRSDSESSDRKTYPKHKTKENIKKNTSDQKNYSKYKLHKTFNEWNEKTYNLKYGNTYNDSDSSSNDSDYEISPKKIPKKSNKNNKSKTIDRVNKSIDEFGAKRASSKKSSSPLQPRPQTKYMMHHKAKVNKNKSKIENKSTTSDSSPDSEEYLKLSKRYTQPRNENEKHSPVYRNVSKEIEVSDSDSDSDDQFVSYNRTHPVPKPKKHSILEDSSDSDDFMHSLSAVVPIDRNAIAEPQDSDKEEKRHSNFYGKRLKHQLYSSSTSDSDEPPHLRHLPPIPVSSSSSDDDFYAPRKPKPNPKLKADPQPREIQKTETTSPLSIGHHTSLLISRPVSLQSPSPPPSSPQQAIQTPSVSAVDAILSDSSSGPLLTKPSFGRAADSDSDSIDELIKRSTAIANTPPSVRSPVAVPSLSESSEESDDELMRRVSSHLARSRQPPVDSELDVDSGVGVTGAVSASGSEDELMEGKASGIPKANTPEWKEWLRKQVEEFDNKSDDEEISPGSVDVAPEAEAIEQSPRRASDILGVGSDSDSPKNNSGPSESGSGAEIDSDDYKEMINKVLSSPSSS